MLCSCREPFLELVFGMIFNPYRPGIGFDGDGGLCGRARRRHVDGDQPHSQFINPLLPEGGAVRAMAMH